MIDFQSSSNAQNSILKMYKNLVFQKPCTKIYLLTCTKIQVQNFREKCTKILASLGTMLVYKESNPFNTQLTCISTMQEDTVEWTNRIVLLGLVSINVVLISNPTIQLFDGSTLFFIKIKATRCQEPYQ